MNKSQRIYFDTGNSTTDRYIKIKLEQGVETLEFMSMNLSTKDAYQIFNADYGVLVGKVIANEGIGVPNAKISVFIPLTTEDENNGRIKSIYPYKTPRDKDYNGKRYNLLPRVSKINPKDGTISPKQPFGSFPTKEEILTNDLFLEVYKKYYRYTTTTNNSGDYMLFGIPTGTQTIHMSVDITDIGDFSMNPAGMVTMGYSPNLFTNNNSKIKPSNDLNDLPNIETQEIATDIIPFWGDVENFEIGITRQDFKIRSVLKNSFVVFGSVFTDYDKTMQGNPADPDKQDVYQFYTMSNDNGLTSYQNQGIFYKREGEVTEKIYYYPSNVSDDDIDAGIAVDEMLLLDKSEYSVYKSGGNFVFIINCNRKKITYDDRGNEINVDDSYQGGLYTEFRGFITLEISDKTLALDWIGHGDHLYFKPLRHKLKFPQHADGYLNTSTGLYISKTFKNPAICTTAEQDNDAWRKEYFTFCYNKIYSFSKFHGIIANTCSSSGDEGNTNQNYGFIEGDNINEAVFPFGEHNAGIIQTNDLGYTGNTLMEMCSNSCTYRYTYDRNARGCVQYFGANWLNLSVYLPQTGWIYDNYSYVYCWRGNPTLAYARKNDTFMMTNNQQQIAGSYYNTCSFARSDLNWTDIIEVPKQDIVNMNKILTKGFKTCNDGKTIVTPNGEYMLQGTYRNGINIPTNRIPSWNCASPYNGGRINGNCTCTTCDPVTYFFKGVHNSNSIEYLISLGIV